MSTRPTKNHTMTRAAARRVFRACLVDFPPYLQHDLDRTFGPRLGALDRPVFEAMVATEFPQLTAAQRATVDEAFHWWRGELDHRDHVEAEVAATRVTVRQIYESVRHLWLPKGAAR